MNTQKIEHVFSNLADKYRRYRVSYPKALYDYLVSISPDKKVVWDCATGNGQAAFMLKDYFDYVIATDLSQEQLNYAMLDPKISYYKASCDHSLIRESSVDLVTVACAAHWFDLTKFEQECYRVCKANGVVALWWLLGFPAIDHNIDIIINDFYHDITRPYFNEVGRKYFEEDYATLELDFNSISHQQFELAVDWNYYDLVGYLSSLSHVQNYINAQGMNPVSFIEDELKKNWGELRAKKRTVWTLLVKCYRR